MSESKGSGQAMVVREADSSALAMVMEPSEALQRLRDLQAFIASVMVEGEDYGVLPGTKPTKDAEGNVLPPKKVLYQPGAQKLAEVYGLAVTFTDERPPIERWDDGDPMFAYFKRATVTRRKDGLFLGSGVGSCNSKEKKYASRWVFERDVLPGMDINRLPRKEGVGRNNKPYVQFKVPNPEIFDLVNTIEKMACKRALVGAVISVTRSSALFTQDLDDMGDGGKARPAQRHDEDHVHEGEFEEEPIPAPRPAPPTLEEITDRAIASGIEAAREQSADKYKHAKAQILGYCQRFGVPSVARDAAVERFKIEVATAAKAEDAGQTNSSGEPGDTAGAV